MLVLLFDIMRLSKKSESARESSALELLEQEAATGALLSLPIQKTSNFLIFCSGLVC